ncbi:MAG: hypothetical protein HC923_02410, partial [Myxococcales bacterium]|nr:hypothetical protein [Myxococcales bacterium]
MKRTLATSTLVLLSLACGDTKSPPPKERSRTSTTAVSAIPAEPTPEQEKALANPLHKAHQERRRGS